MRRKKQDSSRAPVPCVYKPSALDQILVMILHARVAIHDRLVCLVPDLDDLVGRARHGINDDAGHGHLLLVGDRSAATDRSHRTRAARSVRGRDMTFSSVAKPENETKQCREGQRTGTFEAPVAAVVARPFDGSHQ